MTASFQIIFNSSFTYHPFILCCNVTESVSLNKLHINKKEINNIARHRVLVAAALALLCNNMETMSWDNSVSTATRYGLDDCG
jgi:hypothetical protein